MTSTREAACLFDDIDRHNRRSQRRSTRTTSRATRNWTRDMIDIDVAIAIEEDDSSTISPPVSPVYCPPLLVAPSSPLCPPSPDYPPYEDISELQQPLLPPPPLPVAFTITTTTTSSATTTTIDMNCDDDNDAASTDIDSDATLVYNEPENLPNFEEEQPPLDHQHQHYEQCDVAKPPPPIARLASPAECAVRLLTSLDICPVTIMHKRCEYKQCAISERFLRREPPFVPEDYLLITNAFHPLYGQL